MAVPPHLRAAMKMNETTTITPAAAISTPAGQYTFKKKKPAWSHEFPPLGVPRNNNAPDVAPLGIPRNINAPDVAPLGIPRTNNAAIAPTVERAALLKRQRTCLHRHPGVFAYDVSSQRPCRIYSGEGRERKCDESGQIPTVVFMCVICKLKMCRSCWKAEVEIVTDDEERERWVAELLHRGGELPAGMWHINPGDDDYYGSESESE